MNSELITLTVNKPLTSTSTFIYRLNEKGEKIELKDVKECIIEFKAGESYPKATYKTLDGKVHHAFLVEIDK